MHSYSINNDFKLKIFFTLALISLGILFLLKQVITMAENYTFYITPPSAFTIFLLLYILFDKFLWKEKVFHAIGIVNTPIVEGKWSGVLKSSQDNFENNYPIKIIVHQTWDKISICLDGDTKESESTMANIRVVNPSKSELEWAFLSRNKPQYSDENYMCYGVAKVNLEIINGNLISDTIRGSYYTEKGSDTFGEIQLTRIS